MAERRHTEVKIWKETKPHLDRLLLDASSAEGRRLSTPEVLDRILKSQEVKIRTINDASLRRFKK